MRRFGERLARSDLGTGIGGADLIEHLGEAALQIALLDQPARLGVDVVQDSCCR